METIRSIEAMTAAISWRRNNRQIGLVSTKGNLHSGHVALIKACMSDADISVVSVYVNPLEFADDEAFANYPRNVAADRALLERLGVDYLFLPTDNEMFPAGVRDVTTVRLPHLAVELQGAENPRLFNARATAWLKLYNIIRPDVAYFGEKDMQELVLIRRMIAELNLTLKLHSEPIVRDDNRVALAGGLSQLTPSEQLQAPILYQTLNDVAYAVRNGARNFNKLEHTAKLALRGGGFATEYVAIRDSDTLAPPSQVSQQLRVLAAARLGLARLTDNISVDI